MILFAPFAEKQPWLNGHPSPKDYPWAKELAEILRDDLVQVGGSQDEQLVPDFRQNLPFAQLGELIKASKTAICVDSYLQHYYWYVDKPCIVLWGISDPIIFGHTLHMNLLKDRKYLRENQFDLYYHNQINSEAFVKPEKVIEALQSL